jgi:F5/8 type C domain
MCKATVEWFWRGVTLAEQRRAVPELDDRAALFAQRARGSAEIAQSALSPDEPQEMPAEGSASELYRQSVYWSLCALSETAGRAVGDGYAESIWDTLERPFLRGAISSADRVEAVWRSLRAGSFVSFAELPRSEQLATCSELRKLAEALLVRLDQRSRALNGILIQRAWRLGSLVLAVLVVAAGAFWVRGTLRERSDLAVGRPWRASSQMASVCTSPAQQCSAAAGYFFHTTEERNPWIEFDLGAVHQLSRVQVDNRKDCCTERAIPLAVEVSTDHERWHQVARQDAEFATWDAPVAPVQGRWVRLRALSRTYLHLDRVRIF